MAQLWGGRFTKETDKAVYDFNASISFDKRFLRQDIEGSIAHSTMLGDTGIITKEEASEIISGLEGILTDVEFAYTEDELSENDIIVMVSDGAVSSGEEWIERIIMRWDEKSMQELADLINDEAAAGRTDGHDDDITVIAMRIKKR